MQGHHLLLEIPSLAYVEQQIISKAIEIDSWSEAVSQVERQFELPDGCLGNGSFRQTRALSLLYCLVLVPKELFRHDIVLSSEGVSQAFQDWFSRIGPDDMERVRSWRPNRLLRFVRNSIAHVDYAFFEDRIVFFGQDQKSEMSLTISVPGLEAFLETVGASIATIANAQKSVFQR